MRIFSIFTLTIGIMALASCEEETQDNATAATRQYKGQISGFHNATFTGKAVDHVENTAGIQGLWTFQFGAISNEDFDNPVSLNLIFEILFTDVTPGTYPLVGEENGNYYLQDDATLLDRNTNGLFIDGVYYRYKDFRDPTGEVEITSVSEQAMHGKVTLSGDWQMSDTGNQTWVEQGAGTMTFEFTLPRE